MKTRIFSSMLLLFVIGSQMFAQSDYETLQNFKKQYKQIEESIKNVSSPNECDIIAGKINDLKNDFAGSKAMLDKALYPENFESSFVKINAGVESKKKDFTQISTLSTQVASLQTQVSELNQKNEELIRQIDELRTKSEKDQATILELKRLVGLLRVNINQRDMLVRDLVDSLLVEFIKSPQNLSSKEQKIIISKVKKQNLFYNIERTIADNIQFTKVTQMTADDYSQMKKQYHDFDKVWKQVGPRLSSVYLNTKQKKSEITQIDSLFLQWNDQINNGIWNAVYNLFQEKNINLVPFNSADAFVGSVSSFIDSEIKNLGVKSKGESENTFRVFSDDIYSKTVEQKWIPILIENKMMTGTQKAIIDSKIDAWKKAVSSSFPYWVFIIAGAILLLAVLFLLRRMKKPSIQTDKSSAN